MHESRDSPYPVEVNDLHFARDGRSIFEGINLRLAKGSITAVMGPSGTGKTTLLRLIGGQLQPKCGSIVVMGANIVGMRQKPLYTLREKMGMLFQQSALLSDYTVFENVAFPLRAHTRLPERLIRDLVLMKLQQVGLRGARDLMPAQLSGGMARRVALARAIALDPDIVMYDEPFAGLDPISMGVIVKLLRTLNDALNLTSIIVSHDVAETSSIADFTYLLSGGKIVAEGTPEQLRHETNELARQFMLGLEDGPVPFHYPAPPMNTDFFQ